MTTYEIKSYSVKLISRFNDYNTGAIISFCSDDQVQIELRFLYDGYPCPPSQAEGRHLFVFFPYQALENTLYLLNTHKENILTFDGSKAELISTPLA